MHSVATAWGDLGEYQSDQPTQYVPLSIPLLLIVFSILKVLGYVLFGNRQDRLTNLEVVLKF